MGSHSVQALPTLRYGGSIPRYQVHRWELEWWWTLIPGVGLYKVLADVREGQIWYILEARDSSGKYSDWDTLIPDNGLVVYKVEWIRRVIGGIREQVNVLRVDQAWKVNEDIIAGEGRGARFTPISADFEPTYSVAVEIEYPYPRSKTFVMYQIPYELEPLPRETELQPDLDLHAYTPDGLHVGVNYETGEYEIQIPGAIASGDLFNGSEWISVPENLEVYFFISSRDTEKFVKSYPEVELENGMYAFELRYASGGKDFLSPTQGQIVPAGMETFHAIRVTQMPDGTYSVTVEPGMYLFDTGVWDIIIDNIPDDLFLNQGANRKGALKNKLDATLKMVAENNHMGAMQKLEQDILEKLDADGKADWTREPVLIREIQALISRLRVETGGRYQCER